MNYTTDDKNTIVFLNDKNIVSTLTGDSETGYNAIPSHSLFVKEISSLDGRLSDVEASCIYLEEVDKAIYTYVDTVSGDLNAKLTAYSNELCAKAFKHADDLCSSISATTKLSIEDAKTKIYDDIKASCDTLDKTLKEYSDGISAKLSDQIVAEYVHLSGDVVDGNLSIASNLSVANAIIAKDANVYENVAIGKNAKASKNSVAIGENADAHDCSSFVWNGTGDKYCSQKDGSFNLNLKDGLSGIYVGTKTLESIVEDKLARVSSEVTAWSSEISNTISTNYVRADNAISSALCTAVSNNYALCNNVYSKTEVNTISNAISSAVSSAGYVIPTNISFSYVGGTDTDPNHRIELSIVNGIGEPRVLSIDTAEFEKGRMLSSVRVVDDSDRGKALELVFELEDGTTKAIDLPLSSLAKIYTNGFGINIGDDLTISVTNAIATTEQLETLNNTLTSNYYLKTSTSSDEQLKTEFAKYQPSGNYALCNDVYSKTELDAKFNKYTLTSIFDEVSTQVSQIQNYVNELSGPSTPEVGIIKTLSDNISSLWRENVRDLKFDEVITLKIGDIDSENNKTLKKFFHAHAIDRDGKVINGAVYKFIFEDTLPVSSVIVVGGTLSIGNNDYIVIRKDSDDKFVSLDELSANGDGDSSTNIHVTNAVHRYQFEAVDQRLSTVEASCIMLSNRCDDLSDACDGLCIAIDNKISVDGLSVDAFKFLHINADDYHKMVIDDTVDKNTLYVLSSDYINAYDQQMKNLAEPTDKADATTKSYVDQLVNQTSCNLSSQLCTASCDLSTQLFNVSTDISTFMREKLSADLSSLSNELCETSCSICLSVASISSAVALSVNAICSFMRDELSNDLSTLSNELCQTSCSICLSIENISAFMRDTLSADLYKLSGEVSATSSYLSIQLTSQLCTASCELTSDDKYLSSSIDNVSSAIDKKVYIDGISAETLSAIHLCADDYYDLVINETIDEHTLYVLSSDYINAYDEQIKYVAAPTDDSDAATKNYVDNSVEDSSKEMSSQLCTASCDLSTQLFNVSTDICSFMEKELSADLSTLSNELCETSCSICLSIDNLSSSYLKNSYVTSILANMQKDKVLSGGVSMTSDVSLILSAAVFVFNNLSSAFMSVAKDLTVDLTGLTS